MPAETSSPRVAIACGGTGGHLFPGVAVGGALRNRGCAVTLLISPKEIDQTAVKTSTGMQVATIPAVGLNGNAVVFTRGLVSSYRAAAKLFKTERPEAVLAMGGFTSAPPVLAGRAIGAPTFLHESNTIPGRANRWLSWMVGQAFVGFPQASSRLHTRNCKVTGTPVRAPFQPADDAACRLALGLDPQLPVLVVTGGSQGASGLNNLVIGALPFLLKLLPGLQLFHLTGPNDAAKVSAACAAHGIRAVVHPFFAEMHLALGAASVVVARAGASSLAELAAMRVPSILVPFPAATDNHQFYNAQALEKTGAAILMEQKSARPEMLAARVNELALPGAVREKMRTALEQWHFPNAADQIAESIVQAIAARRRATGKTISSPATNFQSRQTAIT